MPRSAGAGSAATRSTLDLDMPVERIYAHPDVAADSGPRGAEARSDRLLPGGGRQRRAAAPARAAARVAIVAHFEPDLLGGVATLSGTARGDPPGRRARSIEPHHGRPRACPSRPCPTLSGITASPARWWSGCRRRDHDLRQSRYQGQQSEGGNDDREQVTSDYLFALGARASRCVAAASAQTIDDIIKSGKVVIGVNTTTPIFGLIGKDGQPEGYDPDVARLIGKYLGVPGRVRVGDRRQPHPATC